MLNITIIILLRYRWNLKYCPTVTLSRPLNGKSMAATLTLNNVLVGNFDSLAYQCLLKNELLGAGIIDLKQSKKQAEETTNDNNCNGTAAAMGSPATSSSGRRRVLFPRENNNLFQVRLSVSWGSFTRDLNVRPSSCQRFFLFYRDGTKMPHFTFAVTC